MIKTILIVATLLVGVKAPGRGSFFKNWKSWFGLGRRTNSTKPKHDEGMELTELNNPKAKQSRGKITEKLDVETVNTHVRTLMGVFKLYENEWMKSILKEDVGKLNKTAKEDVIKLLNERIANNLVIEDVIKLWNEKPWTHPNVLNMILLDLESLGEENGEFLKRAAKSRKHSDLLRLAWCHPKESKKMVKLLMKLNAPSAKVRLKKGKLLSKKNKRRKGHGNVKITFRRYGSGNKHFTDLKSLIQGTSVPVHKKPHTSPVSWTRIQSILDKHRMWITFTKSKREFPLEANNIKFYLKHKNSNRHRFDVTILGNEGELTLKFSNTFERLEFMLLWFFTGEDILFDGIINEIDKISGYREQLETLDVTKLKDQGEKLLNLLGNDELTRKKAKQVQKAIENLDANRIKVQDPQLQGEISDLVGKLKEAALGKLDEL